MCRICVSLGLVRSIPESRFLVLFLACVFSLNPIFELLLGRGHTKGLRIFRFRHSEAFRALGSDPLLFLVLLGDRALRLPCRCRKLQQALQTSLKLCTKLKSSSLPKPLALNPEP